MLVFKDSDGHTPLEIAEKEEYTKCIEYLQSNYDDVSDNSSSVNSYSELQEFVNFKYDEQYTSLHLAVKSGNVQDVKSLIAIGADVSIKATRYEYAPLYFAVKGGNKEIVRILIEAGAGRKAVAEINKTPFSFLVNALDIGAPLPGTALNNVALDNQLRRGSASF